MPGFSINGDTNLNHKLEPKMKYRWKFIIPSIGVILPVEKTRRPTLKWNEKPLKKGHETIYFASDVVWEPLSLTLYDTAQNPNVVEELMKFYESKYTNADRNKFIGNKKNSPSDYKEDFNLEMLDWSGAVIEKWVLYGAWIQNLAFGELTYTASDLAKIELTIRFDRAEILEINSVRPGKGDFSGHYVDRGYTPQSLG